MIVTRDELKRIAERSDRAFEDCRPARQQMEELYEYVLPYRAPKGSRAANSESRTDRIFDSTASKAAFRFAGRMSQDVTPNRFFDLKVGPFLTIGGQMPTADQKQAIEKDLALVTEKVNAVLEGNDFAVAAGEMYLDLFGGTGALLMPQSKRDVLKFTAVPVGEIALEEDGLGKVNGIHWPKEYQAQNLKALWPDATLSERLEKLVKDSPAEPVKVLQSTVFDDASGRWLFYAFQPDHLEDAPLHASQERTCPWLTPRFYKVPGEAMGRGPGMIGLATAKTLNKVTELTIKAAAFAVLGLWIYKNDRVFNPKTAKMRPGAMWAVGSTGGSMGASLQRLEVPGRFDVSNLILQDLREAVKQAMLDDTLPPDSGAVRSATEIVERMKRLSADLSGAYSRLVLEIARPLVQRVIDVLHARNLIATKLEIDQLLFKVEISAPIAKQRQAQDVSSIVEWLQIILSLGGQEAMMLTAVVESVFADIGRKMGVPEKLIRSERDKAKLQQLVAQTILAQQAAAQPPPSGPPPPPPAGALR